MESNRNHPAAKLFSMEPNTLGRKFGIGVRIASRKLLDRAAQGAPPATGSNVPGPARQAVPSTQVYAAQGKAVAKGTRKFGEAVWKPFAHASGVLWLEVTGLFFGIFALFFGINTYKLRNQWAIGPDHQRFVVYTLVTLIFAYFAFSSFYRARKKERLKRQSR
ncbi:hypothetical protein H7849_25370 [Alloacidobacterium dinghuense]|uniref:Uncharacterized protein n=1 Tax=Alloacidobacterium dinghuense TaxID=2763107 RepID=A0A7G8BIA5_9BACT|nr:hypothetical protein [Alloacidobacterium dinghuense]QNI32275.1 hypothetical protein H7849_25370 [Alloacidobacterium dinghuense]